MNNTVTVAPGSAGAELLLKMLQAGGPGVEFEFTEGYSVPLYEVGDIIQTYGDSGPWSPARVRNVTREFVGFDYGPKFKHSTSLPIHSSSIRTDKRKATAPVLKARLVDVEMEWVTL